MKILEPNVPDERAERLDGIDFVALRANEPQAKGFVGIFWEPLLSVGGVVVTGVLESVEARVAQWHSAALERLARATQRRRRPGARVIATDAANRGEKPLQMPPPRCQLALICPAFDVSRDCGVGPGEHRFVISENAAQATNGRGVGDRVGVVAMVPVGRGQRAAHDLMGADQQFACAVGAEQFLGL